MKRYSAVYLFVLFSTFMNAQDSAKVLSHEIGFNTVSLIKQVVSNNPTAATIQQLPYDIFYNLYYQDLIGLRVGLGYTQQHNETAISGQLIPRTTNQSALNLRVGLSYNFVRSKKLTLNCFGDVILEKIKAETVSTTTMQTFGNPIETVYTKSNDQIDGIGAQIGVGVKYNIIKHLSVYIEVPFVFVTEKTTSSFFTTQVGVVPDPTIPVVNSQTKVFLPTTVYLILKF